MSGSSKILWIMAAWLICSSCGSSRKAPVVSSPANGDEQGLEVPEKTSLPQDRDAIRQAADGWWAQSKNHYVERMAWYDYAKFGCFIHWGVYSVPAGVWKGKAIGGYSEHLMRKEKIPLAEYKELVHDFNPSAFDADEWMKTVADAGMKYFIITAKHHDGFAMYPSDAYPYDIRLTKFGRDPMKELREAARKYGIKFGFYYSHAFDWEHPDAPGNDWDYNNPGGDKLIGGANWWEGERRSFLPKAEKYVMEKSIPQIQELIANYEPDILWFDTPHKLPLYLNIRILEAIRKTPHGDDIVVNGRLVRFGNQNMGDYKNCGDRAAYFSPVEGKWESIPTTNESYGYSSTDTLRKPASHFIQLLATAVSRGGNILMNVGPMGNGKWDERDKTIFHQIGTWLRTYGESIYGANPSGLPVQPWGVTTQKGDTLYAHVYQIPASGIIILGGLRTKIHKAWMVANPSVSVSFGHVTADDYQLQIPSSSRDASNTVIAMKVASTSDMNSVRLLSSTTENLAAFDAQLHGEGLTYGDGKVNRNHVKNWKNSEQYISWTIRLNTPQTYKFSLQYNTESASDTGSVFVEVNNKTYEVSYNACTERQGSRTIPVATISLPRGISTIYLKGKNYLGKSYLNPIALKLEHY